MLSARSGWETSTPLSITAAVTPAPVKPRAFTSVMRMMGRACVRFALPGASRSMRTTPPRSRRARIAAGEASPATASTARKTRRTVKDPAGRPARMPARASATASARRPRTGSANATITRTEPAASSPATTSLPTREDATIRARAAGASAAAAGRARVATRVSARRETTRVAGVTGRAIPLPAGVELERAGERPIELPRPDGPERRHEVREPRLEHHQAHLRHPGGFRTSREQPELPPCSRDPVEVGPAEKPQHRVRDRPELLRHVVVVVGRGGRLAHRLGPRAGHDVSDDAARSPGLLARRLHVRGRRLGVLGERLADRLPVGQLAVEAPGAQVGHEAEDEVGDRPVVEDQVEQRALEAARDAAPVAPHGLQADELDLLPGLAD